MPIMSPRTSAMASPASKASAPGRKRDKRKIARGSPAIMLSAILFLLCDIHVIYHMTKRELNSYYFELSNMMRGIFCKIGILKKQNKTKHIL